MDTETGDKTGNQDTLVNLLRQRSMDSYHGQKKKQKLSAGSSDSGPGSGIETD